MSNMKKIDGGVCTPLGFYADGVSAGLKGGEAKDVAFIYSQNLCDVSAVFTTNKMAAAPITHARTISESNFILINAKNANAMTGKEGLEDIHDILKTLSTKHKNLINPLMSSTGVIGVRLPKEKILNAALSFDLTCKDDSAAAEAIMTTDRFSKSIAYELTCKDAKTFRMGAMAKGAGMINPAMATMLCFITTDAKISKDLMQPILDRVNQKTFNAASVDGDTSTNDTVFILANGESDCIDLELFEQALEATMEFLAKEMVRDGEGATKLVTYEMRGAKDDAEAEVAAKSLSNSLLVKTALYGEDPNWGRIAASIGASGVTCNEATLSIAYDDVKLYEKGVNLFNADLEAAASKVMKQDAFTVFCDLGVGEGTFRAYGCDLGYEYVKINADYRT
ncbi:MAG: bifunctional glutamate N-acetyltransferase/amino-acid acetyltransferase ArgJ [Campylobacterota bacterium]|nr:bifunctional glutamate N-acetyltransferase/amino-acid acetyltransferase ArgJ [Campylobacterota bacterium]